MCFFHTKRRARETTEALLEAWPADMRAEMAVGEDVLISERDAGFTVNMTTAEHDRPTLCASAWG
jgi:hypothetical protein